MTRKFEIEKKKKKNVTTQDGGVYHQIWHTQSFVPYHILAWKKRKIYWYRNSVITIQCDISYHWMRHNYCDVIAYQKWLKIEFFKNIYIIRYCLAHAWREKTNCPIWHSYPISSCHIITFKKKKIILFMGYFFVLFW